MHFLSQTSNKWLIIWSIIYIYKLYKGGIINKNQSLKSFEQRRVALTFPTIPFNHNQSSPITFIHNPPFPFIPHYSPISQSIPYILSPPIIPLSYIPTISYPLSSIFPILSHIPFQFSHFYSISTLYRLI